MRLLSLFLFLTFFVPSPFFAQTPTSIKVMGRGTVRLLMPDGWNAPSSEIGEQGDLSLRFDRTKAGEGTAYMSVMRTVFTSEKDRTELVDEIMGSISASLREQAIDTHMVIRQIEGEQLRGGVVTATDKTFDPSANTEGEPSYPAVAEGTLFIDNVMITFTIMTAKEWNSIAKDVIDALRGLSIDPISYASWKRSFPSFVTTTLPIPSQEWTIGFFSRVLTNKKEDSTSGRYQYMASSDRFTISIFVEQPKGDATSHTKCFEYYWPRARRNPAIQQETIQTAATPYYHRVEYDSKGTYKDRPYLQRSVNYFFAYAGRWVDVHISVIDPTEADSAIFNAMDLSLRYGK